MYDVNAQGVDERMINVHHYYYYYYLEGHRASLWDADILCLY